METFRTGTRMSRHGRHRSVSSTREDKACKPPTSALHLGSFSERTIWYTALPILPLQSPLRLKVSSAVFDVCCELDVTLSLRSDYTLFEFE